MDTTSTHPPRTAPTTAETGRFGEDLAARHLSERGCTILARNWRCPAGELDLVARDGDVLVVCEVKTRSSADYGHPVEAVTARKRARLRRLAVAYVHEHKGELRGITALRVDVIGIVRPPSGPVRLRHIAGIDS